MHRPATSSPTAHATSPRLDSCSLGRPVHLLPQVAEALRETLNQLLRQHWNRRYNTRYEIVAARLTPFDAKAAWGAGRWLQTRETTEAVACMIERRLVLHMLAHRLGLVAGAQPDMAIDTPETATEDRLLHALARSVAERCLRMLRGLAPRDDAQTPEPAPPGAWVAVHAPHPAAGAWLLSLELQAPDLDTSRLLLVIDAHAMDGVLRALSARQRGARAARREASAQPLGRRLQLTLKAQLLESQLPLAQVLALRPGSLIPVHLEQAVVQVEGSALFQAQVAEHQGKLCLTSFQDME
jgi:flagellar motor switch protein FliM